MKSKIIYLFTFCLLTVLAKAQPDSNTVRPVIDGYVQENSSSFIGSNVEIYLRNATNYHREAYFTFAIDTIDSVKTATFKLITKDIRANLNNNGTLRIDLFGYSGNLRPDTLNYANQPGTSIFTVIDTNTFATSGDPSVSFDVTTFLNTEIQAGTDTVTFLMLSKTTNAYAQFWAMDTSNTSLQPGIFIEPENCPDTLTVNLGADQTITIDDSITLDAGSRYTSYLWSSGDTTQTLNVSNYTLGVGKHNISVMVTDSMGCSASDTVEVEIVEPAIDCEWAGEYREDKNGWFTQGVNLEVKNDLFGDVNTPANTGPFYSRETFIHFDLTKLPSDVDSLWLRLMPIKFSYVSGFDANTDFPITVTIANGEEDRTLTWTADANSNNSWHNLLTLNYNTTLVNQYQIGENSNKNSNGDFTFVYFDLTSFYDSVGSAYNSITFKIAAPFDQTSSLVTFRDDESSIQGERPKLEYTTSTIGLKEQVASKERIEVYPVPAEDILNVKALGKYSVSLYNLIGSKVLETSIENQGQVDVSALKPGVYILRLLSGNQSRAAKIQIK